MYIEPTLKNILSQSWEIFQSNFITILIVVILIGIPLNIMIELIPSGDDLEGSLSYIRYMSYIQGLFGILSTIAIAFITKSALEHNSITWQESLKLAFNKWLQVIGTNFLGGLLLVLLFLLFIVPGIIYSVFWYFAMYIAIFSNNWGLAALKQSKELVRNRWWKTFGFTLLFTVAVFFVGIIAGIPFVYLPENFALYVLGDLFIDTAISFFSVLGAVFYFAWDSTKVITPVASESK